MWALEPLSVFDHTLGGSFTIFRNWLVLEGAVPPEPARAQMSKPQDTERNDLFNTPPWPRATLDPPS